MYFSLRNIQCNYVFFAEKYKCQKAQASPVRFQFYSSSSTRVVFGWDKETPSQRDWINSANVNMVRNYLICLVSFGSVNTEATRQQSRVAFYMHPVVSCFLHSHSIRRPRERMTRWSRIVQASRDITRYRIALPYLITA